MAEIESSAGPDTGTPVDRLTNARLLSLDRVPIRTRESGVTLSGWQLSIESDEGKGAIVLVEAPASKSWYRGDGLFLGWSPEDLRAAYELLRPRAETGAFEIQQLG